MNKRFMIKLTALALAIIQLLILVSCQNEQGQEGVTTDPVTTSDTDTVTDAPTGGGTKLLDENGKLKYTVIKYAPDPDEITFTAIKKLRDKIKEYTGVTPTLRPSYMNDANKPNPDTFEILVGDTGYSESDSVLEDVGYGDYRIKTVGNKIVIAAYSSDEISRAINYIVNTMLREKDDNGNYKLEISEYEFFTEHTYETISINGNDLSEYSIAYGTVGTEDSYNLESAKILRQFFSEEGGYLLPLIKDTDPCETKRKIYVGASFNRLDDSVNPGSVGGMNYCFKTVNEDFYIMGGGLLSTHLAVADFLSHYFKKGSANDGKVNITDYTGTYLKVTEAPKAAGTDIRVMTYNITAQWEGWGGDYMPIAMRYEGFKSVMDIYDPDIVGLQEVSSEWSNIILSKMGGEYAYVHQNTPDGKFVNLSTIIYRKDRFTLISDGLQYLNPQGPNHIRLVTWAILKDKQTGDSFAFFNTHWDPSYTQHHTDNIDIVNKVMADNPNVKYAFSTGDYNTKPGSVPYTAFLAKTGLVNSRDVARASGTLKNDLGGCAKIGVNKEEVTTTGPIDHIFITKNIKVLSYETVIWNAVHHVSDHSPKYADIVFGD